MNQSTVLSGNKRFWEEITFCYNGHVATKTPQDSVVILNDVPSITCRRRLSNNGCNSSLEPSAKTPIELATGGEGNDANDA